MIAAVLVFALLCLLAFFLIKDNTVKMPVDSSQQAEANLPNDDETPDNTPDDIPDDTPDDIPNDTPEDEPADTPSDEPSNENPPSSDESSPNTPDKENEDPNTPETPTPGPTVTTAVYLYRDAKNGDDFAVNADLDNAVVIIGVSTVSSNGEYVIPETLNGKKVIAITALAFSDESVKDTVKKVLVPSSVKTIHANAFALCNNLTDIYFYGKAIYVDVNAFPPLENRTGDLTIHCSFDCSDRNFRYYRNSAVYYDAKYEEWNG